MKQSDTPDPEGRRKTLERLLNRAVVKRNKKNPYVQARRKHCYDMTSPVRGYCLIFSNFKFTPESKFIALPGYVRDTDLFQKIFIQLNFKCKLFENISTATMKEKMKYYANKSASKGQHPTNACAIIILTHGRRDILFGSSHKPGHPDSINEEQILDIFSNEKCEHLRRKPKVFFISACRGEKTDPGIPSTATETEATDIYSTANISEPMLLSDQQNPSPTESSRLASTIDDTVVCYATSPGYVSYVRLNGSVFGIELARTIMANAFNNDLHGLLNKVSNAVDGRDVVWNRGSAKQTVHVQQFGWKNKLYFNPHFSTTRTPAPQPTEVPLEIISSLGPPPILGQTMDSVERQVQQETVRTPEKRKSDPKSKNSKLSPGRGQKLLTDLWTRRPQTRTDATEQIHPQSSSTD